MTDRPATPSFEKKLEIGGLDSEPRAVALTADEADRASLAAFLKVPAIAALSGEGRFRRDGDLITVQGSLTASLTRECVATLEEMTEEIDEDFFVTFTTDVPDHDPAEEIEADLDAPEPIEGDTLDAGEVFLEQLVLAMSPHPRKEGAEPVEDPGAGASISPFTVLEGLKSD